MSSVIDNTPFSGLSDKEEETEEEDQEEEDDDDDDDDELDEEELIKQMLAKEQQKLSQENNQPTNDDENEETDAPSAPSDSEHFSEQTTSSSDVISSTTTVTTSATETVSHSNSSSTVSSTANTYPVSSTGRCPYCGASDVKYIIIVSENTKDTDLPQSLQELLKRNHAFKMAKGEVHKARTTSRDFSITLIVAKLSLKYIRVFLVAMFIYNCCPTLDLSSMQMLSHS